LATSLIIRAAFASLFCVAASAAALAGPAHPLPIIETTLTPTTPVVVFGPEARLTPDEFAARNHLSADVVKRRHTASGVIHCGNARGAGQLTLSTSVITTAAHVLFDEQGNPRADNARCVFTTTVGGEDVTTPIDVASIVAGNTNPYANPAVHDWAVARLMRPVVGATPYGLGPSAQSGEGIEFVARGHSDWGGGKAMSLEDCRLHDRLSLGGEGTREFSFDCDAGVGASGGALLTPNGRLLGVFVGYRSVAPDKVMPFSAQHYNFGVSIDGAFRKAVETVAGTPSAISSR
jgi:Trypsin-like peptidase domain